MRRKFTASEMKWLEMQSASTDRFMPSVVPLYQLDERHRPEILGSGVLVEIGATVYLLTAQHVADDAAKLASVYIPAGPKLELLADGEYRFVPDLDVAAFKVSPAQLRRLANFRPLSQEEIGVDPDMTKYQNAVLLGNPVTGSKYRLKGRRLRCETLKYSGEIKMCDAEHVHVFFDRNQSISPKTGAFVRVRDPHGMSGGAIIGCNLEQRSPKLIGIMTDWKRETRTIAGTSMMTVLRLLRDGWSDGNIGLLGPDDFPMIPLPPSWKLLLRPPAS